MSTLETVEALAGRYVVTGRIGSGGMGRVLRARDSVLGRTVALKVLPVDLASQPGFVDRFRAEAKAAARVSHPGVVQVHDWGEEDRTYYMVMEYVRGRNLRQILSKGPVEPAQACEIMAQILAALGAAHEKGLVHRDVKPENILVAVDGTVKVTDFGIARVVEAAGLTGSLMGTVAYAAPEQARGEKVDGRTDLYSAGCLLYELLTGSLPFEGDVVSILHQHLNGRVPAPSSQNPAVAPLDSIVRKATAPEPAGRYSSAAEMRTEVLAVAKFLPQPSALSELTREVTGEVALESMETALPGVQRSRRRSKRMILTLVLAGSLAAAWFFGVSTVPSVAGLGRPAALQRIRDAGLDPALRTQFSDAPENTVLSSKPGPGRPMLKGTEVTLVVSAGPELTDLPSLTGTHIDEVKKRIAGSGLVLGNLEERHDRQQGGLVLGQEPQPGKVRKGDPVNLIVSKGPEIIALPNLAGTPFTESENLLRQKGFDVVRENVFNDDLAGRVVGQTPKPGETHPQGTVVKLAVSKGPAPFSMPDLKGKPCTEARAAGAGLVITIRSSGGGEAPCGANRVLEQDPLPGTTVNKGREATLYVSG